MSAAAGGNCPTYISSHSADVILSDIRPIKLKPDALRSVNVFVDEFLYTILGTAGSLHTDQLRAALLRILPTSLGKEALLEAEVELRAYWDRTGGGSQVPTEYEFQLHWAFELLRVKCEAYSTLNEHDEDVEAEARLRELMGPASEPAPTALVAPAALYLTAILEALCEHVLANVGRVASRDSSRTTATVEDLFVALCEDEAIYGTFKAMAVYDQIEHSSKAPAPRRSKSFSRDVRAASRASSHHDAASLKDPPPRSRPASEAQPRSSFDKAKAMRVFSNRSSVDGESQPGHKRSESVLSDNTKQTLAAYDEAEQPPYEDAALLEEFDHLMRTEDTMKVSLTPDRLTNMEAYKQEKSRRLAALSNSDRNSSPVPPRANGRRPSLVHVDSIVEDEENADVKTPVQGRERQASVSSPTTTPLPAAANRTRSMSTASAANVHRNLSNGGMPPPPLPTPKKIVRRVPPKDIYSPQYSSPQPAKTRKIQRNRESMDLDDIMGASDDDEAPPPTQSPQTPQTPQTPKTPRTAPYVSPRTRDLIDFLAEGPPEAPPVSRSGDLADFLAQGDENTRPGASVVSLDSTKRRGGGLRRMISKLSIGNYEKSHQGRNGISVDEISKPSPPGSYRAASINGLANRPVPPRPPPISPPSSPSQGSLDEVTQATTQGSQQISPQQANSLASPQQPNTRTRLMSVPRRAIPAWEDKPADLPLPRVPAPQENGYARRSPSLLETPPSSGGTPNGTQKDERLRTLSTAVSPPAVRSAEQSTALLFPRPPPEAPSPIRPARRMTSPSSVPPPAGTLRPAPPPALPSPTRPAPMHVADVRDMRRLLASATTADECRLILDMFLVRAGAAREPAGCDDVPYPSPSPSEHRVQRPDAVLTSTLVEMLLSADDGGFAVLPPPPPPRRGEGTYEQRDAALASPHAHPDTPDVAA